MRIKSIAALRKEAAEQGSHALKRSLTAWNLITIGIGIIIGAGLFSLTGIAAANYTGPAVVLSFAIAALACIFCALCYAEFASMVPVAGSAYTYTYATLGERMAWIIGWDLILEFSVATAAVSISWSQYLSRFLGNLGIRLPQQWVTSPFEIIHQADGSTVHGIVNLPAMLIVVIMTLVIIRGTKGSAMLNTVIVALKTGVVFTFIVLGFRYINPENYQPFIPENTGSFGSFGFSGILRGAGLLFFVFIGFDVVATMAQEAKHPQRNMPVGIIGSLVICTILFMLFGFVMTGMAHYTSFKDSAAPVAVAIQHTPHQWLGQAIIIAILIGYISVIMIGLIGQSRMFYSMSRDGLLPPVFARVHPGFLTPLKSNLIICAAIALFAGLVPIQVVGELTSIGTLLAFIIVCIAVIILRKRMPHAPRAFKTPYVPLIPALGIICCVTMMLSLPVATWIRLVVWLALGLIIYQGYGRKNSKLGKKLQLAAQRNAGLPVGHAGQPETTELLHQ